MVVLRSTAAIVAFTISVVSMLVPNVVCKAPPEIVNPVPVRSVKPSPLIVSVCPAPIVAPALSVTSPLKVGLLIMSTVTVSVAPAVEVKLPEPPAAIVTVSPPLIDCGVPVEPARVKKVVPLAAQLAQTIVVVLDARHWLFAPLANRVAFVPL